MRGINSLLYVGRSGKIGGTCLVFFPIIACLREIPYKMRLIPHSIKKASSGLGLSIQID